MMYFEHIDGLRAGDTQSSFELRVPSEAEITPTRGPDRGRTASERGSPRAAACSRRPRGARNTADGSAGNHHHLAHGDLEIRVCRQGGNGPGPRGQRRGGSDHPGCRVCAGWGRGPRRAPAMLPAASGLPKLLVSVKLKVIGRSRDSAANAGRAWLGWRGASPGLGPTPGPNGGDRSILPAAHRGEDCFPLFAAGDPGVAARLAGRVAARRPGAAQPPRPPSRLEAPLRFTSPA